MNYSPGDHVAIFPLNSSELVDGIITRLHNAPPPDQLVKLEVIQELTTPMGKCSIPIDCKQTYFCEYFISRSALSSPIQLDLIFRFSNSHYVVR